MATSLKPAFQVIIPRHMEARLAGWVVRMNRMRWTWSVPRERLAIVVITAVCLAGWITTNGRNAQASAFSTSTAGGNPQSVPILVAEVVKFYPHDPHAFTQGLEYYDGYLYESTGRSGQSTLRRTVLETGAVLNQVNLPSEYFGEGLTIFRGKIYQLTAVEDWIHLRCTHLS